MVYTPAMNNGSLTELSFSGFLEQLAAGSPTPGGGAAVALAGAMGAALASMVCRFTIGRDEFAAVQDEVEQLLTESEAARAALELAAEQDAAAYGRVVAARRLPRASEQEKAARAHAIRTATLEAAEEPLEAARVAARLLDTCSRLAELGNPRVLSDVEVGAMLALVALRGAVVNVEANLPGLGDDPFVVVARTEVAHLLDARESQVEALRARIRHRA
ncbi:MAG: cyclodeaminase/cyclohydrolase family protein [Chloroflexi bacterium]|nr:cyclodeaminase/cyclohydrolase family protein [Chloroflexota bacterium]